MFIWTFRVVESCGGSTPRWQRPERGWRALGICAGSVGDSRPGELTDERVCAFRVPSSGIEADGSNGHRSARRLPCVSVSFFRANGDLQSSLMSRSNEPKMLHTVLPVCRACDASTYARPAERGVSAAPGIAPTMAPVIKLGSEGPALVLCRVAATRLLSGPAPG
jgi:hypothetical protein